MAGIGGRNARGRTASALCLWVLLGSASGRAQAGPTLEELGFPPRAPFDHTTGSFAVRFDRLPEPARPEAMLSRLVEPGREPATAGPPIDLAREVFFVYVPPSYDGKEDYGLFVWVSPVDFGGTLRPEIRTLLDARRLIWIGAHGAGNERAGLDRHALALTAALAAPDHWRIDRTRIWVGGYSGGGRVASQLALLWPEVFRGGLFVRGCNWYQPLDVPGQRGRVWKASFPRPPQETLRLDRERSRFVFLTSERDFNRDETRQEVRAARREGFRGLLYLEVPDQDHLGVVPASFFERAFDFLGGRDVEGDAMR